LESIPWLALAVGGTVYAATYLTLCYAPGIAEPAAIRLPIVERITQGFNGLRPRPTPHASASGVEAEAFRLRPGA
jgi:hypothetical protein